MLKKEFKRKDVERVRNLVRGKANESAETQVGYKKKTEDYKEGDIWIENRKTWTIKNGIKQTISKLDKIGLDPILLNLSVIFSNFSTSLFIDDKISSVGKFFFSSKSSSNFSLQLLKDFLK